MAAERWIPWLALALGILALLLVLVFGIQNKDLRYAADVSSARRLGALETEVSNLRAEISVQRDRYSELHAYVVALYAREARAGLNPPPPPTESEP